MGRYADLVPTNWVDSILTGPDAALPHGGGPYHGPDIERLLLAVKARILAAEVEDAQKEPKEDA